MTESLPEAALAYANGGFPIFPCWPQSKSPMTDNGFKAATTNLDRIREWWSATPAANIGFVPGRAGFIVIDIDGPEGESSARRLGLFSEPTWAVQTPRGLHLYFRHPGGHIGNREIAPGIDVRADAGYVLLPPSIHPTLEPYRIDARERVLELPPDARQCFKETSSNVGQGVPEWDTSAPINAGTPARRRYVEEAIYRECMAIANAKRPVGRGKGANKGERNNTLNRAAFALARFIETGESTEGALRNALTIAAHHTGLRDHEIQRTIDSAFRARRTAA